MSHIPTTRFPNLETSPSERTPRRGCQEWEVGGSGTAFRGREKENIRWQGKEGRGRKVEVRDGARVLLSENAARVSVCEKRVRVKLRVTWEKRSRGTEQRERKEKRVRATRTTTTVLYSLARSPLDGVMNRLPLSHSLLLSRIFQREYYNGGEGEVLVVRLTSPTTALLRTPPDYYITSGETREGFFP